MLKTDQFKGESHSSKTANITAGTHDKTTVNALTPTYSNVQPACVVRSPQIGYGGRARRAHRKRCQPFFDRITGKMLQNGKLTVLNLLTGQKSGFSPRRCDSLHPITSNLAWPTGTRVPWLYIISRQPAQGMGMRSQNIESFQFSKIVTSQV